MPRISMIVPFLALVAAPAFAQESSSTSSEAVRPEAEQQQAQQQTGQQQQSLGEPVKVVDGPFLSSAADTKIVDVAGETVGEIAEILIDREGNPAAFLVELDGILGLSDGHVTMPLNSLRYDGTAYVTEMTKSEIDQLQTFSD